VPCLSLAQQSRFVQAELLKTIKAKNAKPGDPVKARAVTSANLPGGVSIAEGAVLLGQVRSADPRSLAISFDEAEMDGKKTPLSLSIRAAMMPGGSETHSGVAAQTGSIIGMPGVTLHVDDSPQHASKFESAGKELQLSHGLQLMLSVPH